MIHFAAFNSKGSWQNICPRVNRANAVATWDPSIQTHASSSKWFKSNWIDENEHSHSDHGKFQSPVWLAVVLAVMADRDADRSSQTSSRRESIPGTLHDTPGGISESFSPVSLFLPRSRERRARLEQDNAPSCCPPSTPTSTNTKEIVTFDTRRNWRPLRTIAARFATILRAVK
jgi:hypothetical protein